MKRLLLAMVATTLLVVPSIAQTQDNVSRTSEEMSLPEFRQTLVDLGVFLDAQRGTQLASQFANTKDEVLVKIYSGVPNPRKFQSAVATLKSLGVSNLGTDGGQSASFSRNRRANLGGAGGGMTPGIVYTDPSCQGMIIENSPGAPCTPGYPDYTNSAWQSLVSPPNTFGAFSPNDFQSIASQQCGLTFESTLSQVVSALNGTVTVAAIACGGLGLIPLVGGDAVAACDIVVAAVGIAGAVSQGILNDCSEQDGNVNAAEIDAGFQNTVTIYNSLQSVGNVVNAIDNDVNNIGTQLTGFGTQLTTDNNQITGEFNTIGNQVSVGFSALTNQITGVNTNINGQFTSLGNSFTTLLNTDTSQITGEFNTIDNQVSQGFSALTTQVTGVNTNINGQFTSLSSNLSGLLNTDNNQITGEFNTIGNQVSQGINALSNQITGVNNNMNGQFAALTTNLTGQITALTNDLNKQAATTDAQITALAAQLTQTTALLQAYAKALMRLAMTPDTQRDVIYPILTCTGTNCPNVLQQCAGGAKGCFYNALGPD